jgi:hypothetical protein
VRADHLVLWGLPLAPALAAFAVAPGSTTLPLCVLFFTIVVAFRARALVERTIVVVFMAFLATALSRSTGVGGEVVVVTLAAFALTAAAPFLLRAVLDAREGSRVRASRLRSVLQLGALSMSVTAALLCRSRHSAPVSDLVAALALLVCLTTWPLSMSAWLGLRAFDPKTFLARCSPGETTVDYGVGDGVDTHRLEAPAGFRENAAPRVLHVVGDRQPALAVVRNGWVFATLALIGAFSAARFVVQHS